MAQMKTSALVVEDDPVSRQIVSRMLAKAGIVCDTASDGVQAKQYLATTRYDLVVTDLQMPNGNGHALCVQLLKKTPRPAIVVITGVLDPRLATDLLNRGVDKVLFKPIDCEALIEFAQGACGLAPAAHA